VLSAISMGAIVLDPERRIVLWNSWMQQYSGHQHRTGAGPAF
jgi:hypothetical protein